jgi:transcriptional regulator with XRE-family HTH domain
MVSMNFFGAKLTSVLVSEGKTQGQLAQEAGVSQSLVTYLTSGKQTCSIKFLKKIIEASSEDPFKRADLLAAHLWDHMQAAGSAKSLVQILINAHDAKQTFQSSDFVDLRDSSKPPERKQEKILVGRIAQQSKLGS